MIVCPQCNGKAATIGQEAIIDLSSNTQSFQTPQNKQGAVPCTQCGGRGYY